jgi:uncharacterized membrane protein
MMGIASGLSVITLLIYALLFVLIVLFLYNGYVYFRRSNEVKEKLMYKLDRIIEILDKETHGNKKEE